MRELLGPSGKNALPNLAPGLARRINRAQVATQNWLRAGSRQNCGNEHLHKLQILEAGHTVAPRVKEMKPIQAQTGAWKAEKLSGELSGRRNRRSVTQQIACIIRRSHLPEGRWSVE